MWQSDVNHVHPGLRYSGSAERSDATPCPTRHEQRWGRRRCVFTPGSRDCETGGAYWVWKHSQGMGPPKNRLRMMNNVTHGSINQPKYQHSSSFHCAETLAPCLLGGMCASRRRGYHIQDLSWSTSVCHVAATTPGPHSVTFPWTWTPWQSSERPSNSASFQWMSMRPQFYSVFSNSQWSSIAKNDKAEHSIEMQLPFLALLLPESHRNSLLAKSDAKWNKARPKEAACYVGANARWTGGLLTLCRIESRAISYTRLFSKLGIKTQTIPPQTAESSQVSATVRSPQGGCQEWGSLRPLACSLTDERRHRLCSGLTIPSGADFRLLHKQRSAFSARWSQAIFVIGVPNSAIRGWVRNPEHSLATDMTELRRGSPGLAKTYRDGPHPDNARIEVTSWVLWQFSWKELCQGLDREGMTLIEQQDADGFRKCAINSTTFWLVQPCCLGKAERFPAALFARYLQREGNTICGQDLSVPLSHLQQLYLQKFVICDHWSVWVSKNPQNDGQTNPEVCW